MAVPKYMARSLLPFLSCATGACPLMKLSSNHLAGSDQISRLDLSERIRPRLWMTSYSKNGDARLRTFLGGTTCNGPDSRKRVLGIPMTLCSSASALLPIEGFLEGNRSTSPPGIHPIPNSWSAERPQIKLGARPVQQSDAWRSIARQVCVRVYWRLVFCRCRHSKP